MPRIILASESPARQNLLRQIKILFSVVPSKIQESQRRFATPKEQVQTLAAEKARHVASRTKHGLVIGADTIIVRKGKVIGKPRTRSEAVKILKELSGTTHSVFTGLAVVDAATGRSSVDYVKTSVKMKKLTQKEIEAYVSTGESFGKAGAYAAQGKGAILIERVDGCYCNVVGLPLPKLGDMLKKFNVSLLRYDSRNV